MVFWHSSAHVLGEACELHYGCHLCIGPPIQDGYYYEMGGMAAPVSPSDFPALDTKTKKICSEKQRFERLVLSKENLLEMFKHNKYKVHIIQDKIPDGTSTTVYRCGPLIDLCYGPHVTDTGKIKAMMVLKVSKRLNFTRTLHHTFSEMLKMNRFSAFTASLFLSKVCSKSTRFSWKKLRNEITVKLVKTKNSSFSTN